MKKTTIMVISLLALNTSSLTHARFEGSKHDFSSMEGVGKDVCKVCHGVDCSVGKKDEKRNTFLYKMIDILFLAKDDGNTPEDIRLDTNTKICLSCHIDPLGKVDSRKANPPYQLNSCIYGSYQGPNPSAKPTMPLTSGTVSLPANSRGLSSGVVVGVTSKGKNKNRICAECHSIHKSDNPHLVTDEFILANPKLNR